MLVARNENLTRYLNDFIEKNRLRWVYLRSQKFRTKLGLIVTFVDVDNLGRKDLYVGVSKTATNKGDTFSLDLGLVKAIENAMPASAFLEILDSNPDFLPRIPITWKNVRDQHGYVTGEIEWYDQYEAFASKLRRIYPTLNLTPLSVVG